MGGIIVLVIALCTMVVMSRSLPLADDDVFLLNDGDFKETTSSSAMVLVLFYAPWSARSQKVYPEFHAAAPLLRPYGVMMVAVDGASKSRQELMAYPFISAALNTTREFVAGTATSQRLGVTTFPSFKVLHYGRLNDQVPPMPHTTSGIVDLMFHMARPPSLELLTVSDAVRAIRENRNKSTIAVGFYPDRGHAHVFQEIGNVFRGTVMFYHTSTPAVIEHFPSSFSNTFVMFLHHSDDGTEYSNAFRGKRHVGYVLADGTKLDSLNGDVMIFDGRTRQQQIGGERYSRDVVVQYVATYGFSPIGILTGRNRHLYNARNCSTLFMFLPFELPVEGAEKGDSVPNPAITGTCKDDAAGNCVDDAGEVLPLNHPHVVEPSRKEEPEKTKSNKALQGEPVPKNGGFLSKLTPELRYYANRFRKILQKGPQYHNYSFLFVNPTENDQVFRQFGFDYNMLTPKPSRLKQRNSLGVNNLIGVVVGERKYRYPYDFFDIELLQAFLDNINMHRLPVFTASAPPPDKEPSHGEGKIFPVVYATFDRLIKKDVRRDSVVAMLSPYDELSRRAFRSLEHIANAEIGNDEFMVAVMDGTGNDPVLDFETATLPSIFYVPRKDKKRLRLSDSVTADGPSRFKLHSYDGDFSVESIAGFVTEEATVPLKSKLLSAKKKP